MHQFTAQGQQGFKQHQLLASQSSSQLSSTQAYQQTTSSSLLSQLKHSASDSQLSALLDENSKNSKNSQLANKSNTSQQSNSQPADKYFNPTEWSVSRFLIGRPLGSGGFGRVYLAKEKDSGFICVLKSVKKSAIKDANGLKLISREVEINSNLNHDNILKMYGYFADALRFYLILEYADTGDLYGYMHKQPNSRFSEAQAAEYVKQIIKAIEYLHSKGVIHRDIKPENILVCNSGQTLKLSDFGWSVKHNRNANRKTFCGTLDYTPPEMLRTKLEGKVNQYGFAVDLWAIGVLAYELNAGVAPFFDQNSKNALVKIYKLDLNLPRYFSPQLKDFLGKVLTRDPHNRLTIPQMLAHDWITRKGPLQNLKPQTGFF